MVQPHPSPTFSVDGNHFVVYLSGFICVLTADRLLKANTTD